MIQSKIVEAKIVDDAAVIEANIGKLTAQESLAVLALCGKFDRLMELQEEYYRQHPLRRLLRNLRLLPDPYVPARLWALEQIEGRDREMPN